MQDLIEINLKRCNCFYQLHADGIVSLDLDFKMQFGQSLLQLEEWKESYLGSNQYCGFCMTRNRTSHLLITSQTRNHQAAEPTMKNSRSNSLLTLKCELLFEMTEQSYPLCLH